MADQRSRTSPPGRAAQSFSTSGHWVVADLGATHLRVARLGSSWEVEDRRRVRTPSSAPAQRSLMLELMSELGAHESSGVGVGVAARVDWTTGFVLAGGILDPWNLPLRDILVEEFGVPAIVDNDANLAAYGEAHMGAGSDRGLGVTVTVGTGLGGAVTLDGQLIRGRGWAGEFGHIPVFGASGPLCGCGRAGCWETRASGRSLRQRIGERSGESALDLARQGDGPMRDVLLRWARDLDRGIQALDAALNPDWLVFGGGLGAIAVGALDLAHEVAPGSVSGVGFKVGALRDDAGMIGAALLAEAATDRHPRSRLAVSGPSATDRDQKGTVR